MAAAFPLLKRWKTAAAPSAHVGASTDRQSGLYRWLPLLAVVVPPVAILAGGLAWLSTHADETVSRRVLRTPSAVAAFDLSKPVSAAEFAAYKAAASGKVQETEQDVAPDTFRTATFDRVPETPVLSPVAPARVDSTLQETTPSGPLPVIGPDGRKPWQAYSQPVDPGKLENAKGTIAVVVSNAGLSVPMLKAFLAGLPAGLTFAFNPYAPELDQWMGETRARGHEVLMGLPMEPREFPRFDPGPRAMMKDYSEERNIKAMHWALGRGAGYVGVMTIMGDALTETAWRIQPVLEEARKRGLLFIDASTERGQEVSSESATALDLPYLPAAFQMGDDPDPAAIQKVLLKAQKAATGRKPVVLVVPPYPVVLDLLRQWLPMLEREKIVLVPVSHLAAATAKK